jgi:hypothetical protein
MHATPELRHVALQIPMPDTIEGTQAAFVPNLPWAEHHFVERVSGQPLNPGEQYKNWPWARGNVDQHRTQGAAFSHTYMERYWPKFAMVGETAPNGRQIFVPHMGIRFEYGDLDDVIEQLRKDPLTRQAYLPVWFPEDTGAVPGERVPCTLGYHFMISPVQFGSGPSDLFYQLDVDYFIRSCDFVRHFRDDIYLTVRLAQWLRNQVLAIEDVVPELEMGDLHMWIGSLHCFEGDRAKLEGKT